MTDVYEGDIKRKTIKKDHMDQYEDAKHLFHL